MYDEWEIRMDAIYNILALDKNLRSYVPALFTEIDITHDKVTVKVPHQVLSTVSDYLERHYRCGVPLEVIGV